MVHTGWARSTAQTVMTAIDANEFPQTFELIDIKLSSGAG
jgi:hypothetical protein